MLQVNLSTPESATDGRHGSSNQTPIGEWGLTKRTLHPKCQTQNPNEVLWLRSRFGWGGFAFEPSLDASSVHARPLVPSIESHFWKISSTFGDECPQNGSKNEPRAQRTSLGYPHIGPFVGIRLDAVRSMESLYAVCGC